MKERPVIDQLKISLNIKQTEEEDVVVMRKSDRRLGQIVQEPEAL